MIVETILGLLIIYLIVVAIRLLAKLMDAPWTKGLGLLALVTFIKVKKLQKVSVQKVPKNANR